MNIQGYQNRATSSHDLAPNRYGTNSARIATNPVMVRRYASDAAIVAPHCGHGKALVSFRSSSLILA